MTDEQKIYIRGIKGRSEDIIKMLEEKGGFNYYNSNCEDTKRLYFIDHKGLISSALLDRECSKIIMDNYRELKLADWKWKPSQGELYYTIETNMGNIEIHARHYRSDDFTDLNFKKTGNCFKTKEEAKEAAERVLEALKGELSK